MFRVIRFTVILVAIGGALPHRSAEAGLFFHHEKGTPPPGCPRYIEYSHARAGYPLNLNPCAKPGDTPEYVRYYVGGGAGSHHGDPRNSDLGTWGRDYQGHWIPRHVGLLWSYGRLYQGGTGAYEPDGPHVPDVIGLTASKLRNH
jgi:hypothetical protein